MVFDQKWQIGYWLNKLALAGSLAGTGYFLVSMIYIVLSRIRYPFSLEFVEGDSLIQVYRILHGLLIYTQPSYRYIALDYPPLYFYVSALFARLLGFGFFPLRLVSFISSLACIVLIYLINRKEGAAPVPALLAAGLFAATYRLAGTWFDIGRVDMLALSLLLLAVYLARFKTLAAYTVAGFVFALSCLTKQTNLLILAFLVAYLILFERPRSLAFVVTSIGTFALASLWLDRAYSGWYTFYVFTITLGSGGNALTAQMVLEAARKFWIDDLWLPLPLATLSLIAYFAMKILKERDALLAFQLCFAAGMLSTSWAALAHPGGADNVLLPAYAMVAIIWGLVLHKLISQQNLHSLLRSAFMGACVVQFVILYYPIRPQIPTHADLLAGQSLVAEIQKQKGNVYVHFHPELALMAGKPTYADWVTTYQLEGGFGGGDARQTNRVKTEFANAMARREFDMIVLDKGINWIWGHPERYYTLSSEPVFTDPHVFWSITGWWNRPTYKMFPTQR